MERSRDASKLIDGTRWMLDRRPQGTSGPGPVAAGPGQPVGSLRWHSPIADVGISVHRTGLWSTWVTVSNERAVGCPVSVPAWPRLHPDDCVATGQLGYVEQILGLGTRPDVRRDRHHLHPEIRDWSTPSQPGPGTAASTWLIAPSAIGPSALVRCQVGSGWERTKGAPFQGTPGSFPTAPEGRKQPVVAGLAPLEEGRGWPRPTQCIAMDKRSGRRSRNMRALNQLPRQTRSRTECWDGQCKSNRWDAARPLRREPSGVTMGIRCLRFGKSSIWHRQWRYSGMATSCHRTRQRPAQPGRTPYSHSSMCRFHGVPGLTARAARRRHPSARARRPARSHPARPRAIRPPG